MRRVVQRCGRMESLGIEAAAAVGPATCLAWIEATPPAVTSCTRETADAGAVIRNASVMELIPSSVEGILMPERAFARWRNEASVRAHSSVLVHRAAMPTVTAAAADHPWLVVQQRFLIPAEVARAQGLRDDSPVTRALTKGLVSDRQAVSMLGNAIHAGVARLVLGAAIKLCAELRRVPFPATNRRYASCFSGVDTFAEAFDEMCGPEWEYVAASENDPATTRVLLEAWGCRGLSAGRVATSALAPPAWGTGTGAHLWVCSPECVAWSKRAREKDVEAQRMELRNIVAAMAYARARKPLVVILEGVNDRDFVGAVSRLLHASYSSTEYEWRAQMVDSFEHAGVPVHRERWFAVGVRTA